MALRIKLANGGEVSLSKNRRPVEGDGLILMVEHAPSMAVVQCEPSEAKRLAEAILEAVDG